MKLFQTLHFFLYWLSKRIPKITNSCAEHRGPLTIVCLLHWSQKEFSIMRVHSDIKLKLAAYRKIIKAFSSEFLSFLYYKNEITSSSVGKSKYFVFGKKRGHSHKTRLAQSQEIFIYNNVTKEQLIKKTETLELPTDQATGIGPRAKFNALLAIVTFNSEVPIFQYFLYTYTLRIP